MDIEIDGIISDPSLQQYESSLNKFKDERDAIQKKTFTKWVNKHLIKVTKGCVDLFEDLRDGRNLISLLEVLSGEILPRERGRMRVHMLQNVQIALNFLKHRRIKLVNIRAEDIVDGNPKLTLGLIWTIILHFQLSDIVQHDDTLSFREALLRWAQKTTEGYPGVKVTDFTQSWRDGLAFNAILHRNRPDLLDYRACRGRTARENLDNAFNIAEKELGVTRLLDAEDVDTPQPDEKSLITYISSLYELFPEPPEHNPLLDQERIRRVDDYKELANRLNVWMRESIAKLRDRHFPNTLQELKIVQQENNRFRTEEIPPKLHDKQRLASSYKEVLKMSRSLAGVHIEEEHKIENIEQQWNKLITAHQERDHAISEEVSRLEKLHRLAEKLLRDIKQCDTNLDDLERKIEEEEKRVQRLNPLDAKFNIDQIELELKQEEERIKGMFKDVQTLRDGRYDKATELHNRVQQLHQRWSNMKLDFQTKVVQVLADRRAQALKKPLTEEELIKSNLSFKFLYDCIQWVAERLKKIDELDFGHDLQSVKALIEQYKSEHRTIEQFQGKVDQCDSKRNQFQGEEYEIYVRMLNRLHKSYSELLVLSNKRLSDLDTLLDFVQAATNELKWLSDKEEIEVSRDWSSKSVNLVELEQHHRQLIVDLERREHQFNSVQDRGESLIRQRHPATKCIEGLMAKMQSQWSWLLQLINCLDDHLKYTADNHQFYNESRECDQWLSRTEEKLNTTYSKQNFSIEEGEHLLKEMNNVKDDITKFGQIVSQLVSKSKDILPLKQRKAPLPRPIKVRSLCMVKQGTSTVTKNEQVILHDNSQKSKWRVVTSSGAELNVPGVCFIIPPPDQEAIDTANDLKKKYEALVALWARKHHKLRQNMIFATLKIVKGWDYKTYCSMDPNQRNAIIKALEDDIDKIVREGPRDDPGSRRLQDEMDALKKKFAEFDARLRAEQDEKSLQALSKKFSDVASPLLDRLTEKERILVQRAHNQIPRDRDSLESLVIEHKEFENDLNSYEPQIQSMKNLLRDIPTRSAAVQGKHDNIIELWNRIQSLSQLYVERLKAVEIALIDIETASKLVSDVEFRLASVDDMPADEVALRRIHSELVDIQSDIQRNNTAFDHLVSNVTKVRRVVEKTRPKQATHSDVNRLEDEVKNLTRRWENCANQLIERMRSTEACAELLHSYKTRMDSERSWLSQMTAKVNTLVTRREVDLATKLYEQLAERKPSIEDTNASGGRFIREAKIYDLKLKNYREGLEDSHPSLDASAKRARRTPGADIVAQELDKMNKEYAALIDAVHQQLNQLQDDEAKLQEKRLITKLSFKTYHSDLGLMVSQSPELMDSDNNNTITSNNNQQLTASDVTLNKAVYNSNIKTYQTTTILLKSSEKESVSKRYISTGQLKQLSDEAKQLNAEGMLDESVVKSPTNKSQALTFTEIKSVKRHKSESTGTSTDEQLSNKHETSSSSISPPSPKKAISPSDVVKASMNSKKVSNKVETQISLRPKSGDIANETLLLINESSVIGKDSLPQSHNFGEQKFSEYSEEKNDKELSQSVDTSESISESNLRDIINKISKLGVKTKMSFKTDQTQSDSNFKESVINYESIIKGKSSKSYQITKESNVESWTISGSDAHLKTVQKSSKFDNIDLDSELHQSNESNSKKYIKESVSHIPRKSLPEITPKQSDSKEMPSHKHRTSLRDQFAEEDESLTISKADSRSISGSDAHLKTVQKYSKSDNIEEERELHQNIVSDSRKFIKESTILSKKTFKSEQIQGESTLKGSVTNYESIKTGNASKRYQSIKQSQLQTDLSGVISSETNPNIETVITRKGKAILKTSTTQEIESGELNLSTGEFVISATGEKISISEAMERNLLQSQEISLLDRQTGVHKYTISGAFNWLFDKESNKFKDPQTGEMLSFDDLVSKGYVDMNALIYDTVEGTSMSTEEAIREGLINLKTGNVIDSRTKQEISITEATNSGLIAVLCSRSPIISESTDINAESNTITTTTKPNKEPIITEPSADEELSNKLETSESISPSSPKKAMSASDVVKASMKSKKVSNNVETHISLRPKSGDIANETVFDIKESSVIGKDNLPQSQQFSEQNYSKARNGKDLAQSDQKSESNLHDVANKSGVESKLSFKTDQTLSDSNFKESLINNESIIKGKSPKSYQNTKESNVESLPISESDANLKTVEKSSKFDNIDLDSEIHQSNESNSKKYIKESVSHIPRKSMPEITRKQSDSKEMPSQKHRTSLHEQFAEEDQSLTTSKASKFDILCDKNPIISENTDTGSESNSITTPITKPSKEPIITEPSADEELLNKRKTIDTISPSSPKKDLSASDVYDSMKSKKVSNDVEIQISLSPKSGDIANETVFDKEISVIRKDSLPQSHNFGEQEFSEAKNDKEMTKSVDTSKSPPKTLKPISEPGFEVHIGNAQTIPSPEKEVLIKKLSRRSITPNKALEEGLLDSETANILNSLPQSVSLDDAINSNVIDGNRAMLVNPQSGEKVSLSKALDLGIIDNDSKSLILPIGRSLSLPSIIERALYNPKEKKIIHPETGQLLTLTQAISCDIVDKHSKLIEPKTKKSISLENAINKGIVDALTCDITSASERKMSLVEAVKTNYISLPTSLTAKSGAESLIPEIALTERAAIESGLINADTKQFTHPIKKDVMSIADAFTKGYLFDISKYEDTIVAAEVAGIEEQQRRRSLQTKDKDSDKMKSDSKQSIDVKKPTIDKELSIYSPLSAQKADEKLKTDKNEENLLLNIDAKTQSQISTSIVKTTMETVITTKGEVILKTSSAVQSMAQEIKSGELNLSTEEFVISATGEKISIPEAMKRNLLQSQEISLLDRQTGVHKYTISGAFNWLFDKESNKFKDPQTGELLSFDDLVSKGYVDMNALIYDTVEGTSMSTEKAIREGIIDLKTGNVIDSRTKQSIPITEATKSGLIAVLCSRSPITCESTVSGAVSNAMTSSITKSGTVSVSTETMSPIAKKRTASIKSQTDMRGDDISTTTTVTTSKLRPITEAAIMKKFEDEIEDLLAWIDEMTSRLNGFRTLSIYVDKLRDELEELTEISEEIVAHRKKISDVVNSGQDIIVASGDDASFIKSKLDQLQVKFSKLTHKATEKLRQAQDALPIAEQFHSAHNKLNGWMDDAERSLKQIDSLSLSQQESTIQRIEAQIPENRMLLETVSDLGPQLGQISPGQGAATVEGFVLKATRRFDSICSQIQRKAERIESTKQRNNEVIGDIDELFEWFRDVERQLLEAEPITPNPEQLAILLKETKSLNDDINSQKGRVRHVLTNAKKVMRDSSSDDLSNIRAKADDLKELANHVSQLCHDRLSALEQALPLAEHFFDAHNELCQWLDEAENEVQMLGKPALNASQIMKQQQIIKALIQSVSDHKPLVDRLNKTGAALLKLIPEDTGRKIRQIIDSDNNRYNALRNILREQQQALEAALQATSQFVDKLDGMLNALNNTADQLKNAEPIAAHPERIQEQIADNNAILNDLDKRADALEAVRHAAKDVILKAGKSDEPAIRDIKNKLNKLNDLWDHVQKSAKGRGKSLDDALKVAKRFWDELNDVMKALKDIQDNLNNQEPPASEPTAIQQQQETLQDIKQDIDHTKPEVDHVKKTGKNLLDLCGEPDKPEVKKHIDDLDNAWDNVTSLFAKREKNLIDAMEKAMNFHETLQNLLEFLDYAEEKLANMGPIAADIEAIKGQIRDLRNFKAEVDPHMVEVEALNRQANILLESVSPNQARAIREPLNEINRRWDDLLKGIVDRHSELENALLKLGQFQHALNEFLAWMQKTEKTLDEMRPVFGDPQVIEVELAKHKVLMNDIHAHQTIVDTLNIAGKQLMDSERGTENARATQRKLSDLNSRWQQLQDKANQRQKELEDALKEAQAFNHEIQDLLMWLNDVDGQLAASKPVGGLPETAREQLNRFMELFNELEANRSKVENVLKQGNDYLKRSTEGAATNLQHNLKTLKQRWDNVLSRANDRKIKLEIALREATEFHEALQAFVDWLTSSEKYLSNLQPVSRVLDRVLKQIEEHKQFQKDISDHRETMLNLDKKGTHLKYFSQKQDVILIKNLLVSVQHRWEKLVSKAAERTRALDHGHKEAKEFQDAWSDLISWLDDNEKQFASLQQAGNEPDRIKQLLSRHKEFQRALGAKQATYDATMKLGRALKEKAPKPDHSILQDMLDELKNKWNSVCNKSVDRQRKLEEALLYSGQFKDAVQALIDWLDKAKQQLAIDKPVHGDLDTVTALVDQHKSFQEDLKSRAKNLSSVRKTASELLQTANHEDAQHIKEQISILNSKWDEVERLTEQKTRKLEDALRQAEQLHKAVHMLLEWLSDAEMKLRFAGPLPEDEATTRQHIAEHERFMSEMKLQEKNKDSTISLAKEILEKCHPDAIPVIRHWITIIQSRWEEVSAWAKQREQRLQDHLRSLRDIMELLEELLAWLIGAEASLLAAESEPLPDDIITLENLIEEHQRFIDDMNRKEPDVDRVIKAFSSKRQATPHSQPAKGREYDSRRRGVPPRTSTPIRGVEPEIKHPRARELMEKWRIVWKLAMERMKRLQDKLNYNRELDRMRNFDFDEWRRRFLAWMNNKKARIMDFFRKIDKDNDGKVTKADFIDGFLASKFPTSRLEMEKVADVFDRNNDGYIDHKEYLDTLRPDRDGQPKTESEIIQDEVQRQVAKCTCLVRYKVFQVGEGKYRFGESQKLRLVRILRSTVMVRVGGGWVSLDEFLVKNDPCRAKGRTNVELREQFILAEGVSQSMTPFKSKSPIKADGSIQTTGPITKIREKSERSVPMTHQHHHRYGNQTSDYSFSDQADTSGAKSRPRSRLTVGSNGSRPNSRPNSRPGSRQSSRPPSRAGSDLSTESLEDYQQRKTTTTRKYGLTSSVKRTPSIGRTTAANGSATRDRWK